MNNCSSGFCVEIRQFSSSMSSDWVHYEDHEGHEVRTREEHLYSKKIFSSFVLFLCFVVETIS